MSGTTKSAFESDAKMVLKQLEYQTLQDNSFNVITVNEETIVNLNLSNKNYSDLKVAIIDGNPYVFIVGKEKWAGLKACGNIKDVKVVDESDTTTCENIPLTISSMHPQVVSKTCNPDNLTNFCLSEISLLPYAFTPIGYLKCDGSVLTIASYPDLYSLIGTTYGGNGVTTFALPNLTSSSPLTGLSYYIATSGNSPDLNNVSPLTSGNYNYFSHQSTFENYLIGEIKLAANVDASNTMLLPCDGSLLATADYPALFSLIGFTFGGDGSTTFGLPNLSSASSPVSGEKYYIVVSGAYPAR